LAPNVGLVAINGGDFNLEAHIFFKIFCGKKFELRVGGDICIVIYSAARSGFCRGLRRIVLVYSSQIELFRKGSKPIIISKRYSIESLEKVLGDSSITSVSLKQPLGSSFGSLGIFFLLFLIADFILSKAFSSLDSS